MTEHEQMGFMNHGVKLEQSLGSSMFAVLFFTLTIATNVLFLIIEILLWGLTNNEAHLLSASMGIWVVLLGIIAAECAEAPPDTIKKLFFLEIKAVYYPMGTSFSWAVYGLTLNPPINNHPQCYWDCFHYWVGRDCLTVSE